ncbi:type II toxin-antitoxin system tRNA(fMet)-specific endonuclease VapC [Alkalispirochaeta americana]|uniref:type II toxin-antitoxin system tRNA(fMet)-specific endonuclease VapC n=1 Tax=Alkalispirochaeta americana TaxID=159291 RepID=UPI000970566F|nr:type II toxin-antitoxin system VapC family toxin [Alkalispirochaeta americana]
MYLLDTNICIYLMKKKFPKLQSRVESESLFNIALSSVTVAELEYGIAKSNFPNKNRELLYGFLSPFEIIPFSELDAENFGFIRYYLNKQGTPIGPYDLQIASQCLSRNLCIIANNVKEFERVPKLLIENWVQEQNNI